MNTIRVAEYGQAPAIIQISSKKQDYSNNNNISVIIRAGTRMGQMLLAGIYCLKERYHRTTQWGFYSVPRP